MSAKIIVADSPEDFALQCARLVADNAKEAVEKRGQFSIALSGGSLASQLYIRLSEEKGIDWAKTFVFFGDDRFVESENPYSNFSLAFDSLLSRVEIPNGNIFPIDWNASTPALAADSYANTIEAILGEGANNIPKFDFIHLGMGPDGHTASLFPRSSALQIDDSKRIVVTNHAGLKPWVDRITFTLPLINNARTIVITATGEIKAEKIKKAIEHPDENILDLPIAGVSPSHGNLIWLLDKAAASLLGL